MMTSVGIAFALCKSYANSISRRDVMERNCRDFGELADLMATKIVEIVDGQITEGRKE